LATTCKECVVYIHGVTNEQECGHEAQYKLLHSGIRKYQAEWPETFTGVEWGWHPSDAPNPVSHQLLADAERTLGERAIEAVSKASDFTINPLRMAVNEFRPLMINNFSDMFYYVSTQGKAAVRLATARQIVNSLTETLEEPEPLISLTLVGHSAGSVVAFDLLFYLFYANHKAEHFIDFSQIETPKSDKVTPEAAAPVEQTMSALEKLRALAQHDRVRIRRLFTFGSPITSIAFRSDAVLKILSSKAGKSNRINAGFHGLNKNPRAFGQPLKGPRWINIWDKDDLVAWPVEPLMTDTGTIVVDEYVDVSDNPLRAHTAYWDSEEVYRVIGKHW